MLLNAFDRLRFYFNIGNLVSGFRHVSVKLVSIFTDEKIPAEWDELQNPNVYPKPS